MSRVCVHCRKPLPESISDRTCPSCGFALDPVDVTLRALATEGDRQDGFEIGSKLSSKEQSLPATLRHEPEFRRNLPYYPIIPNYTDFEVLGYGGMGTVYRAIQRPTNRPVAIKVMNHFAPGSPMRERFANEVRAHARINHPGVVAIYEVGDCSHGPYFTMEYRPGTTLAMLIKRRQTDDRVAVRILADAAEAIHAAHVQGILHRDIKPSNMLVDADGRVRITDFGLARHCDSATLTLTGVLVGTYAYMSPEQLFGQIDAISKASDVYGLGASLYHALTGRTIRQSQPSGPISPHTLVDELPWNAPIRANLCPTLEAIVRKCLAIDPGKRYETAEQLAKDLRNWLNDRPTLATPPTRVQRFERELRRYRTAVGVILFCAFLALAASVAVRHADPKHRLVSRLNASARSGETVQLVPDRGAPEWSEVKLGSVDLQTPPVRNGAFGFRAESAVLISLVDNPPTPNYRLEADLLYHGNAGLTETDTVNGFSGVGLFIDYQTARFDDGRIAHTAITFPIRDGGHPSQPKVVNGTLFGFFEDSERLLPTSNNMILGSPRFRIPQRDDGQPQWRTIGLTVRDGGVTIEYRESEGKWQSVAVVEPELLAMVSHAARRGMTAIDPILAGMPAEFDSRRPLGIYARQAAVSVRNVTIQPLR